MDHFDVAILGAGPAGSATALTLRRQFDDVRVGLFERSSYRAARIGETVPPVIQPVLDQLGVWAAFVDQHHLRAPATSAAWGSDEPTGNEFIFNRYGPGWHLDRTRFDDMLAGQASLAGVDVRLGGRANIERAQDGHWRLHVRDRVGGYSMATATFVVDATGRRATVATSAGAQPIRFDHLVGATATLRRRGGVAPGDTLIEAVEDGWWYSSTIPGDQFVVAFMGDRDVVGPQWHRPDYWLRRVGATQHTARRIAGGELVTAPRLADASTRRLDRFAGDGWLAVGDAAVTLDPLSSQGLLSALRGGVLAAYAVGDHLSGRGSALEHYGRWLDDGFAAYLHARSVYYQREQRWPHSPFWRQRHEHQPDVDNEATFEGEQRHETLTNRFGRRDRAAHRRGQRVQ